MVDIATTRLIPLHIGKGKTIGQALGRTVDYVENPNKTNEGEFISSFECDPMIAEQQFLFTKSQYTRLTGRKQGSKDVIAYHLRQSFKPDEIDAQTANKIGYDLAMSLTKGKHAFIVCTHVDKQHIHSHIVFNSTSLDCDRKFRNFWNSSFAIRKISDKLCLENGVSIIEKPKKSKGNYATWLKPNQEKKVNLLVDIGAKLDEGKGKGYEQWAKIFNLKQMASTINYLRENNITDLEDLNSKVEKISSEFNTITTDIKLIESSIKDKQELKKCIINYLNTREKFQEYKQSGYSKKLAEKYHAEITLYRASQQYFNEKELKKLPSIKALSTEINSLYKDKNSKYVEYKKLKKEHQEIQIAKANVDRILGENTKKSTKEKSSPQR